MCELGSIRDSGFDTLVNLTADGEEFFKSGGTVGNYDASAQGSFFVEGNCCARWEWSQGSSNDYARNVRIYVEDESGEYQYGYLFRIYLGVLHMQGEWGTGKNPGGLWSYYENGFQFAIRYEEGKIQLEAKGPDDADWVDVFSYMTVPTDRTYHLVIEAAGDSGGTTRIAEISEQDGCDAQGNLPLLEVSMTMTVAAPPLPVGMLPLPEVSMTMSVSPAAEDLCADEMTLTEEDCDDEMTLTEGEVSPS